MSRLTLQRDASLDGMTQPLSIAGTPSTVNIAALQESWVTSDSADFFGGPATDFRSSDAFSTFGSTTEKGPFSSQNFMTSVSSVRPLDPRSAIHDAARITDWEKVLHLCETHPEYAQYAGADGWTALHHTCNRRCPQPRVAQALIEAYPDALLEEEEKGWLPLHYACRFKAPKEVVHLLLSMFPDKGKTSVSRKDRLGRTPLYYAVRYDAPPGVVGLLLQVNPAAVLEEDQNEESPLAVAWNTWADKLEGKRAVHSFLPGGFPEPEGISQEQRTELLWIKLKKNTRLYKRWKLANMLLKGAFGFPVDDEDTHSSSSLGSERKWRILHATAAVKVHVLLFRLACVLHPKQALEFDESDLMRVKDPLLSGVSTHQTALHLAAASNAGGETGKVVVQDLLDLYRNAAHVQDAIDGSLPLHRIVENKHKQDWPNFGSLLCHVYPRALQLPDHNGRLPLHRAAAAITHEISGEDQMSHSVIMNVVRLYPQAASHLDNSGCFPLHILATSAERWDDQAQSVYNAHPPAIHARAGTSLDNRLPIHMAASNPNATDSLVNRLIRLHQRGVSIPDRQGKLPFHLACEIGRDWGDGLSAIHGAFPAAAETPEANTRGWLPLHMVVHCPESTPELIAKVLSLNEGAASVCDTNRRYPLHIGAAAGKRWDTGLQELFDAHSDSLGATDSSGLLPLHIAALHYCKNQDTMKEEEELSELGCLYEMLRSMPAVL